MKSINVDLGSKKYDIIIEKGIINNIAQEINKLYLNKKIAIITDINVFNIYKTKVEESFRVSGYDDKLFRFILIEPGESSKSLEKLKSVYEQLLDFNLTRSDLIIALGGGMVGDLAGFAASTYLRGVDYIQVPTTLLAQIDSSIGGKVAVNLEQGKNLIGSFYQPKKVLIDPSVLETLPDKFIKDGLGEVIKYACIKDALFFDMLLSIKSKEQLLENLEHIMYTCCDIKRELVEKDEYDKGDRMLLNFGHTMAHAIEKYFNYEYTHGEAVSIGMLYITNKSEKQGITELGTSEKIKNMLDNFDIKYQLPTLYMDKIRETILLDKKNISGNMKLILLEKIGRGFIKSVPVDALYKFF